MANAIAWAVTDSRTSGRVYNLGDEPSLSAGAAGGCLARRHLVAVVVSGTANLLDRLKREGQMIGVAGERKETELGVEGGGLIIDRFDLDRPKGDLLGDAKATGEGIQQEEAAEPLTTLGLVN